jgi:hypothetical protein
VRIGRHYGAWIIKRLPHCEASRPTTAGDGAFRTGKAKPSEANPTPDSRQQAGFASQQVRQAAGDRGLSDPRSAEDPRHGVREQVRAGAKLGRAGRVQEAGGVKAFRVDLREAAVETHRFAR